MQSFSGLDVAVSSAGGWLHGYCGRSSDHPGALLHWGCLCPGATVTGCADPHVRPVFVVPSSAFAGFRFPREVIVLAVRWYLRFGLSYRDVEELLAERGIEVDQITVYRGVQPFTPVLADAARPCRHSVGDCWYVDETYVKVAGRWRDVYRAVDHIARSSTCTFPHDARPQAATSSGIGVDKHWIVRAAKTAPCGNGHEHRPPGRARVTCSDVDGSKSLLVSGFFVGTQRA
jgi:hypothetical protein